MTIPDHDFFSRLGSDETKASSRTCQLRVVADQDLPASLDDQQPYSLHVYRAQTQRFVEGSYLMHGTVPA